VKIIYKYILFCHSLAEEVSQFNILLECFNSCFRPSEIVPKEKHQEKAENVVKNESELKRATISYARM